MILDIPGLVAELFQSDEIMHRLPGDTGHRHLADEMQQDDATLGHRQFVPGYSMAMTSIVSMPAGVLRSTVSPSRAFNSARAIGDTQLTRFASDVASSTPTMVIVFSVPSGSHR